MPPGAGNFIEAVPYVRRYVCICLDGTNASSAICGDTKCTTVASFYLFIPESRCHMLKGWKNGKLEVRHLLEEKTLADDI